MKRYAIFPRTNANTKVNNTRKNPKLKNFLAFYGHLMIIGCKYTYMHTYAHIHIHLCPSVHCFKRTCLEWKMTLTKEHVRRLQKKVDRKVSKLALENFWRNKQRTDVSTPILLKGRLRCVSVRPISTRQNWYNKSHLLTLMNSTLKYQFEGYFVLTLVTPVYQ